MTKEFFEPLDSDSLLQYLDVHVVKPEAIQSLVISTIRESSTDILATMDLEEEIQKPLSEEYHKIITVKLQEGVKFYRIGFGSLEHFTLMTSKLNLNSRNYFFIHNPEVNQYRRMILVDRIRLFFRYGDIFYTTPNGLLINKYLNYFKSASSLDIPLPN